MANNLKESFKSAFTAIATFFAKGFATGRWEVKFTWKF